MKLENLEWMELCINVVPAAGAKEREWVKIVNECGNRENALLNLVDDLSNGMNARRAHGVI